MPLNAATRHVAAAAATAGAELVHISTDYVFDGKLDRPYREWDEPNPASVYGASKLAGEREAGPDATVIRTSWVCGANGNNMVKTILRLVEEHSSLSFVDDQRGCPTFTGDLARATSWFVEDHLPGLFHVTNAQPVSWYEFARSVASTAGWDAERVQPIRTIDLAPPRPALRPANSVLENRALAAAGLTSLRGYREALEELLSGQRLMGAH